MKKKLAAILSACLVFSTALFSCGSDDGDDASSGKKSSSSADSSPKYDLNDDEENTTEDEESTTEATTTAKITTTAETTTTKASSSGNSGSSGSSGGMSVIPASDAPEPTGGDIIGIWGPITDKDGMTASLGFEDGNSCSMYVDLSSTMHFTSDGAFYMEEMPVSKDFVIYDGSAIHVKMDFSSFGVDTTDIDDETAEFMNMDIIVLKRVGSADSSTMDGQYKFDGGLFSDAFTESLTASGYSFSEDDLLVVVKGEKLLMEITDLFSYTISGNTLTIESGGSFFTEEFDEGSVKYTVENDTLYLFNEDDEAIALSRMDF